jgi:ubiquinone biosynthesis protein UbiJ
MSLIHSILSRQLNRLLVRDSEYMQSIAPLVGVAIGFKLTDLKFQAVLVFHHTYIEVLPEQSVQQQIDLHLWAKSADFIKFLLAKESRQLLLQKGIVDFSGDLLLLEKLEVLIPTFKHLNVDFFKMIVRNRVAYYQDEKAVWVSPVQLTDFVDRLLQIQFQLDRCEMRLDCLVAAK